MLTALIVTMLTTVGPGEFGLIPGAERTYEVRATGQKPSKYTIRVGKQMIVQGIDTFDVAIDHSRHRFYGVSPDGLFEFYVANMEGTEVDAKTKPIPLYLRSKNVGESWKWVEPFRGQTMADANGKGPDMSKLITYARATLVSRNEKLGSYQTIHVHINRKSEGLGNSSTDSWYAPNVGLVREIVKAKTWSSETVLVR